MSNYQQLQLPGLNLQPKKLTKKTPLQTRAVKKVTIEYPDSSSLVLEVELEQGFHRIEEYRANGKKITIHEVFLTFGEEIENRED